MEPIPSYILKASASHAQKSGVDGFGNPTHSTPVELTKVMFERRKLAAPGAYGDRSAYDATLTYDCLNSRPSGRAFGELDKVTFDGTDYVVRAVDEYRDPFSGGLVYVEVRLAGA